MYIGFKKIQIKSTKFKLFSILKSLRKKNVILYYIYTNLVPKKSLFFVLRQKIIFLEKFFLVDIYYIKIRHQMYRLLIN